MTKSQAFALLAFLAVKLTLSRLSGLQQKSGLMCGMVLLRTLASSELDHPQVCAKVQAAVSDMARESVVRCLPKVLHPNSVLGIELQEDEATATQRATLISMRGRLLVALCSAREIDA